MGFTREEAFKLINREQEWVYDYGLAIGCYALEDIVNAIFDKHEAQIKSKDKRIKELEDLVDSYAEVQNQMTP